MPTVTSAAAGIPSLAGTIMGGPVGGAIGSAIGGLIGGLGATGGDRSNLDRHAIARRVRDANEAGIHPLFALGASVGSSPTFTTGSAGGDALRAGGEALRRHFSAESQAKRAAGMSEVERAQVRSLDAAAARDEAYAVQILSETKRAAQKSINQGLDSAFALNPELFLPFGVELHKSGQSKTVPAEVVSHRTGDPSISAGPNTPGSTEYTGPYFNVRGSPSGEMAPWMIDLQELWKAFREFQYPGSRGAHTGPRGKYESPLTWYKRVFGRKANLDPKRKWRK